MTIFYKQTFDVSIENQTNVSLAARLQKLVNDLCGGNAKQFAENANIIPVTLYNYMKGRTPKADALENICLTYSVNLNWLVSGIGEPYRSTDEHKQLTADPTDPPDLIELLEGARKVLTSGNPVAFDALERNIRYFSHAIEVEKRMQGMEADLAEMKRYVMEMKRQEEAREKSRLEEQSSKRKVA